MLSVNYEKPEVDGSEMTYQMSPWVLPSELD